MFIRNERTLFVRISAPLRLAQVFTSASSTIPFLDYNWVREVRQRIRFRFQVCRFASRSFVTTRLPTPRSPEIPVHTVQKPNGVGLSKGRGSVELISTSERLQNFFFFYQLTVASYKPVCSDLAIATSRRGDRGIHKP